MHRLLCHSKFGQSRGMVNPSPPLAWSPCKSWLQFLILRVHTGTCLRSQKFWVCRGHAHQDGAWLTPGNMSLPCVYYLGKKQQLLEKSLFGDKRNFHVRLAESGKRTFGCELHLGWLGQTLPKWSQKWLSESQRQREVEIWGGSSHADNTPDYIRSVDGVISILKQTTMCRDGSLCMRP